MTSPPLPTTDPGLRLAMAMVAASTAPLLLLDGALQVVAASASFRQTFDIPALGLVGLSVFRMGSGEWDRRQLRALLTAAASGLAEVDAYEMDLVRPGLPVRRLVLNARRLDYDGAQPMRLLLTIADVTESRRRDQLKDDLLRDKAVLLQEVQHRVANSLQIIASVLLQSARKVQSSETRTHLRDAHSRVMSIAAVQRQLSSDTPTAVEVRAYFIQLCDSLGASMIEDHNRIRITVKVDDSRVAAEVSISLGLVVTELVINALKHAFPGERRGHIAVSYDAAGPEWTLAVTDDGVGMPADVAVAQPRLGTSIIQALAQQLHAQIAVSDARPGTAVTLTHRLDDPTPAPGTLGGMSAAI